MGMTALMTAAVSGRTGIARVLLKNHADVNATDNQGRTALGYAIAARHTEIEGLLRAAMEPAHKSPDNAAAHVHSKGLAVFMRAVANEDTETVRLGLDQGMDVNAKDEEGFTPLMVAAVQGCSGVAGLLLRHDADVNAADGAGFTALMYAALYERTDRDTQMVNKVVAPGVVVNMIKIGGAAGQAHLNVTLLLLEHKAEVNARAGDGSTALMAAAGKGNLQTVGLLLRYGADASIADNAGKTALDYALEKGHAKTAAILRKRMVRPD